MKKFVVVYLSLLLHGCAFNIYSTAYNTPFSRYEQITIQEDSVVYQGYRETPIRLYKPALYYKRPRSILFVDASEFRDDFDNAQAITLPISHQDPLIQYNRSVYNLNSALYQIVFAPFIKTYLFITPKSIQNGIRNVLSNVLAPMRMVLNILMGDIRNAGVEMSRFIVNSTAGLLGFIDITKKDTPSSYREVNLEDVFISWGIPSGPFIMLPLLGPRTLRGAIAFPIEIFMDPLDYIIPFPIVFSTLSSVRIVSTSSQYLHLFYMLEKTSVDPYIAQREIFWQYMNKKGEKKPFTRTMEKEAPTKEEERRKEKNNSI